jgi:hypothetical protein
MSALLRLLSFLALWAFGSATAFAQSGTLDQVSPFASDVSSGNGGHFNFDAASLTWQAEAVAGISGVLEGFELELEGDIGNSVDVAILLGTAWQSSAPAWSGTYAKTTDDTEIAWLDASASAIPLTTGDIFVIQITGTGTGTWGTGTYDFRGNTFYGPPLFLNAAPYGDEFRVGFRTWIFPDPELQLLHVGGTCGGVMDFEVNGATPAGPVGFIRAFGLGSFTIPGGPCGGTVLGLDSTSSLALLQTADLSGSLAASAMVPAGACGMVFLQAIDVATCILSDPLLLQ